MPREDQKPQWLLDKEYEKQKLKYDQKPERESPGSTVYADKTDRQENTAFIKDEPSVTQERKTVAERNVAASRNRYVRKKLTAKSVFAIVVLVLVFILFGLPLCYSAYWHLNETIYHGEMKADYSAEIQSASKDQKTYALSYRYFIKINSDKTVSCFEFVRDEDSLAITDIKEMEPNPLRDWKNVTAVQIEMSDVLGMCSDGTLLWGDLSYTPEKQAEIKDYSQRNAITKESDIIDISLKYDMAYALKTDGSYTADSSIMEKLTEKFFGGCCDEVSTRKTIKDIYEQSAYLSDTHTAVAINVYGQYVEKTGDKTPVILASTASPYKFSKSVLISLIPEEKICESEFDMVAQLNELTGTAVPEPLAQLKNKEVRFSSVINSDDMSKYVLERLGIE